MRNALTVALVALIVIATGLVVHGFVIGITSTYRLNADGVVQGITIIAWGGMVGVLSSSLARFTLKLQRSKTSQTN